LQCLDCEGIELAVLTHPDFWKDLMVQELHIPLEIVWHRQVMVGGNNPIISDNFLW
jgi:hypothetical protein